MSTQIRTYKYRIMPTKDQESLLAQFVGAKRWIYNHFLQLNSDAYKNGQKHRSNFDINKEITQLKKQPETVWLRDMDDWLLKSASEDLSTAYKNFFDSLSGKRKGPKVAAPTVKKKSNRQSYRTRGNVKVNFDDSTITVPKIKNIKTIIERQFTGTIKSITISNTPSGKWFASALVEEVISLKPMTGREIGLDLGLKDLIITSTGVKFDHPQQMLAKAKQALKRAQKILARKTKGSNNRKKQRIKVAKCYERITNIRNDYYHILSKWLVDNHDVIHLEDLNVSGMMKNRKLSRKIHETAWSTLSGMISYKANYAGRTVNKISRWFPSSKTCSCCGYKLDKLPLDIREWECPSCETHHDRDLNAAKNILNQGQKDLYGSTTSVASIEEGLNIPKTLMKFANKIERSVQKNSLQRDGVKLNNFDLTVQD